MSNCIRLIKTAGLLLSVLLSSSCTYGAGHTAHDRPWFLGFSAPAYMEAFIETADVVDIQEHLFRRTEGGTASVYMNKNRKNLPLAEGWSGVNRIGSGRHVFRANLPRLIYVRWQSLAEPQVYQAYIVIPESAREIMRKPEKALCRLGPRWITDYRDNVGIGLAPGGIVKVWLAGDCLDAVEIIRVVGTINKKGPDLGKNEGRYAYPTSPVSQEYIDTFGIPYGSW